MTPNGSIYLNNVIFQCFNLSVSEKENPEKCAGRTKLIKCYFLYTRSAGSIPADGPINPEGYTSLIDNLDF